MSGPEGIATFVLEPGWQLGLRLACSELPAECTTMLLVRGTDGHRHAPKCCRTCTQTPTLCASHRPLPGTESGSGHWAGLGSRQRGSILRRWGSSGNKTPRSRLQAPMRVAFSQRLSLTKRIQRENYEEFQDSDSRVLIPKCRPLSDCTCHPPMQPAWLCVLSAVIPLKISYRGNKERFPS